MGYLSGLFWKAARRWPTYRDQEYIVSYLVWEGWNTNFYGANVLKTCDENIYRNILRNCSYSQITKCPTYRDGVWTAKKSVGMQPQRAKIWFSKIWTCRVLSDSWWKAVTRWPTYRVQEYIVRYLVWEGWNTNFYDVNVLKTRHGHVCGQI